ncbi:MAG: hypothetical protein CMA92_01725 [Euryarchaeota archaeon]|nr:hypothetical protein [Euryarchaeota archaeon]|tara:strand:- start:1116 stop:1808 length:693 start_codon:yes stop_codon:yes gene_type:complete
MMSMKLRIISSGAAFVIVGIILSMTLTQLIIDQVIQQISWFSDSGFKGQIAFIGLYIIFGILVIPASFHKYLSGILFGFTFGLLIAWIGGMIAAIIPFLLGKKWLNPYAKKLLNKNPKLKGLEKAIIADKWRTVALSRVSLVIPYGVLNYAFGATDIRLRDYLIGNFAMIVPSIMYAWWGSQTRIIAGAIETQDKGISYVISIVISIILTFWLVIRSTSISRKIQSYENN